MKGKILVLLFLVSFTNLVSSECSNIFGMDCLYETLFGEESSSEESSSEKTQIVTDLSKAVIHLSNTIHKILLQHGDSLDLPILPRLKGKNAKVNQIPSIVTYIQDYTKLLKKNLPASLSESSSEEKKDGKSSTSDSKLEKEVSNLSKLMETLTCSIQGLVKEKSNSKSEAHETKSSKDEATSEEKKDETGTNDLIKEDKKDASLASVDPSSIL